MIVTVFVTVRIVLMVAKHGMQASVLQLPLLYASSLWHRAPRCHPKKRPYLMLMLSQRTTNCTTLNPTRSLLYKCCKLHPPPIHPPHPHTHCIVSRSQTTTLLAEAQQNGGLATLDHTMGYPLAHIRMPFFP